MANKTASDTRLGTEKIGKLMLSMALPAVAAQLINVLYNIVDRMYIGHMAKVGHLALTGVGVAFPILMIISAFSAFAGMGGAPLASISLGKEDREQAERILGNSTLMLIFFAAVLTVTFLVFNKPLLFAFGASEDTIGYAVQYTNIYLCGTIFVQLAVGLNTFISGQGNARTAMLSVLIGAITNIVLDPIFIFAFGMGVRGAALATILSQALSAAWVVRFLTSKKSVVRIRKRNLKADKTILLSIAALGVSPFIMQSTESLVNITLNSGLQKYGGDVYVGTMTILTSIMQLIVVPVQGITQGVQPIISYNYGAGNRDRVMMTFRRMLGVTLAFTILFAGTVILFPEPFARIFNDNPEILKTAKRVMPVFFAGITVFGIQMACQSTFLALGQAKISLFLALLRKVFLLIPLAVILPKFFGVMGIFRAEPIADITAVAATSLMFAVSYKKILAKSPHKLKP